jgi:hypothetical protein
MVRKCSLVTRQRRVMTRASMRSIGKAFRERLSPPPQTKTTWGDDVVSFTATLAVDWSDSRLVLAVNSQSVCWCSVESASSGWTDLILLLVVVVDTYSLLWSG